MIFALLPHVADGRDDEEEVAWENDEEGEDDAFDPGSGENGLQRHKDEEEEDEDEEPEERRVRCSVPAGVLLPNALDNNKSQVIPPCSRTLHVIPWFIIQTDQ